MIPELAAWQLEALRNAATLKISPESVNEALGVLISVFGEEWLSKACVRDLGPPLLFRAHPIGNLLIPPGEHQIVGLLELVEYLKAASSSPVFEDLVAGFKAQYGPTFLQTAFGYRLARLGVSDVEYEPPVQRGLKGDIGFSLEGTRFIAECYIPRLKRSSLEAHWLLQQCMELRGEKQRPVVLSIAVKLRVTPTAEQRKTIVRLVREFASEIEANVTSGNFIDDARFIAIDPAYISVTRSRAVASGENSLLRKHRDFPVLDDVQPFYFARVGVGVQSPARPTAVPKELETRDHVAIWLSDEEEEEHSLKRDLESPLADLTRKLERKLVQTKVDASVGRVLIVSSWITGELGRASDETMSQLRRTLFLKHTGVAALLMVLHSSRRNPARRRYEIDPVLPSTPNDFSIHVENLVKLELERSVPQVIGPSLG